MNHVIHDGGDGAGEGDNNPFKIESFTNEKGERCFRLVAGTNSDGLTYEEWSKLPFMQKLTS